MNTYPTQEDRFEDRLLAAILNDFENLASAPAGYPGRRRQPRRPVTIRRALPVLAAGTAALAIGAAGVLALGPHSAPAPSTTTPAPPKAKTAAFVVRQMQAAVNGNKAVLIVVEHAPDSTTGKPVFDETWSTPHGNTSRSEDFTKTGKPTTGYVLTITPHRTVSIEVNYRARTWSKTTYSFGSASSAPGPAPLPVTPKQSAARLRAQVAAGKVTLIGPATVDGQKAIELRQVSHLGQLSIWVDPQTYLPIREISTPPGVSQTSSQAIRDDYQWLPGTAANRRLVTAAAAIPPGFTEVGS